MEIIILLLYILLAIVILAGIYYVLGMVGIAQQLKVGIMIIIVIIILLVLLQSGSFTLPALRTR